MTTLFEDVVVMGCPHSLGISLSCWDQRLHKGLGMGLSYRNVLATLGTMGRLNINVALLLKGEKN